MCDGGGDGGAQPLAHVDDGVEENSILQPWNLVKPDPGVVDATQKSDGYNDDGEDQADLPGIDSGADDQAQRAGQQTDQHKHQCKEEPVVNVGADRRGGNVPGHGNN